jgi:hypothetical protein
MTTDNGNITTGRDPNTGTFMPGHTLSRGNGGGNPNVRRQAELKKALIACGTEGDIQKLYATLLTAALGGDVQATKLLLDHLVGRPVHVEADDEGGAITIQVIRTQVGITAHAAD